MNKNKLKEFLFECRTRKYATSFCVQSNEASSEKISQYDAMYSHIESITLPSMTQCVGGLIHDDILYCCPANGGALLIYDIKKKCFLTSNGVSSGPLLFSGIGEYNNKIFCFPRKANSLLVHNKINSITEEIMLNTNYSEEHHYCGVITNNGILYQPPRNTNHILKVDLNTFEVKKIPIASSNTKIRYSGIVIHSNGCIYMIPEYGGKVIVLDPRKDNIKFIGKYLNDSRVVGPTVGCDGNIYGALLFGSGLLKIDVQNEKVTVIQDKIEIKSFGLKSINTKLIAFPSYSDEVIEYDILNETIHQIGTVNRSGNKAECAGAAIHNTGDIYIVPCYGQHIYVVKKDTTKEIEYIFDNKF